MSILFHKADIADSEIVIKLLKELYLELGEEAGSIQFLDKRLLEDIFSSGSTGILLAKNGPAGDVMGILTLTRSQAIYAGGRYFTIDEMYVLPPFRSQGVGAKFIEHALSIARAAGCKRVDVTAPTEEKWKRTVKFYEKNGFVFTGPKLKISL